MYEDITFTTHDYAIGGKMIVCRAVVSDHFRMMLEDGDKEARNKIKRELAAQLAEYMLEHNLLEFTQQDDVASGNKHIALRAYLAPNDQIKILRLANKVV
jgi:hypothetical protein